MTKWLSLLRAPTGFPDSRHRKEQGKEREKRAAANALSGSRFASRGGEPLFFCCANAKGDKTCELSAHWQWHSLL